MDFKALFKSKTFYGAILVFIGGGLSAIGLDPFGTLISSAGAALGFVGLRTAKNTI